MNILTTLQRGLLALTLATGFAGAAVTGVYAGGGGPRPDLIVQQTSPAPDGNDRIVISNIGPGYAPTFRVAVLAGADTFSFWVGGLQAHRHLTYTLPAFDCGQPIAVIVDADQQTNDVNYANNGTGFTASCPIDPGANLVPANG